MNGAIPTRALPRLASARVGETALRGLKMYNIGLIKAKSTVAPWRYAIVAACNRDNFSRTRANVNL